MIIDPEKNLEENRKLKELIQRVEPVKAPWYFDARLQQRLAVKGNSPVKWFRPLVAVPVTAAATAFLLYISIPPQHDVDTAAPDGLLLPGLPPDEGRQSLENGGESIHAPALREEEIPLEAQGSSRGPSDEQTEPVRPASIRQEESRQRSGNVSLIVPGLQATGQSYSTAGSVSTVPDSLDSLSVEAVDSVLAPDR